MSVLNEKEIPCSHCKFPNAVEVWSVINVKEDPELKELLVGGELNMAECASCKRVFFAESFLLYHDPEAELLAFVYPYADRSRREETIKKTENDFETLKDGSSESVFALYRPHTFFGMDELVRLLEDEDEKGIQSEIVSVMCKDWGVPVVGLSPSKARELQIPPVVPGAASTKSVSRKDLLAALAKIRSANPRLTKYVEWETAAASNPASELKLA